CQLRKIGAIAPHVACEQWRRRDARVSANKEVGQRARADSAAAPIQSESLRRAKGRGFGQVRQRQVEFLNLRVTIRLRLEPDRELGVDNCVDKQWASSAGRYKRFPTPYSASSAAAMQPSGLFNPICTQPF